MRNFLGWCWFVLILFVSTLFFWVIPIGLLTVAVLCCCKAWTYPLYPTIKPLPNREKIDLFCGLPEFILKLLWNYEDGNSAKQALGKWKGFYNALGTRWKAFCWNCRNWLPGLNYLSWPFKSAPPFWQSKTNSGRKFGWQGLPSADGWVGAFKYRMVCDL